MEKEFDVVDFIISFEGGNIKDSDIVEGFQHLINSGIVWDLQGSYGRMADRLIEQEICKKEGEWSPQEAKDNFLNNRRKRVD